MPTRRVHRRLLTLMPAAALCVGACYNYVPRDTPAVVRPGHLVRVELTDAGVVAIAAQVGPGVYRIDGRVTTVNDSVVVLAAQTLVSRRTNVEQYWNGERVTIPRTAVASVQERLLSKSRTVGLVAVALGTVIGAAAAFDVNGFGGTGGGGNGGNGQ